MRVGPVRSHAAAIRRPPGALYPEVSSMSLSLDRTTHSSPETAYPLVGRTRWYAATLFVIGGLLQLAEFLLEPEHDSSRAGWRWWLAHPTSCSSRRRPGCSRWRS